MADTPDAAPPDEARPRPRQRPADRVFGWLCQSCGVFVILTVAALVTVLVWQGAPALAHAGEYRMFSSSTWDPDTRPPLYGALVFVYGTLVTSAIAMLIAVPLGIGSAAFLAEIAPASVRRVGSFLLELLAAIPSVVYGFWGLKFLVPPLNKLFITLGVSNSASGQGILAAGLILAIMILPYITAISFDACRSVPRSQREGALALGASRWQVIRSVVLPYAKPGITAACFLALGRALGETMAVTMLIGNVRYLNFSLFAAGDSIASVIANQLKEATSDSHVSALMALALILFLITAVTNVLARTLIAWGGKPRVRKPRKAPLFIENLSAEAVAAEEAGLQRGIARARRSNRVMTGVLAACHLLTVLPLFLILGYITVLGAENLDLNFFTQRFRSADAPGGGLAHAMLGSVVMVLLASLAAVPLGILTAVFLSEYRNHRLAGPVRFVTELLGGVPSIVIGIFVFVLLVAPPWMHRPLGFSAYAGAAALGVMMLPVVIRASEEAMRMVPHSLREASYALGGTQRQTVLRVIIPAALPTILTGVLLAMARVAGETAPLLLTARYSNFWPDALDEPTASLPTAVYNYSKSPFPELQRQAWAAAFVLLAAVLIINAVVRLLAGKRSIAASQAG
jgi:phosphate transport system permease protein